MRIEMLRNAVIHATLTGMAGSVHDVPDDIGRQLVAIGKAKAIPVADEAEAAAVGQAKAQARGGKAKAATTRNNPGLVENADNGPDDGPEAA